jgi:4a-hydroxytetrahydrobiopterin dehydratase
MLRLREREGRQESKESRTAKQRTKQLGRDSRGTPSLLTLKALSSKELEEVLQELRGWSQTEGKLHRQFQFSSFERALGFMSGLALVAQTMGHSLQESSLYDCVTVDLTTAEAGGITNLDVELARKADELASCLKLVGR